MTQPQDALKILFIDDNANMQFVDLKRTLETSLRNVRKSLTFDWDVCEDRQEGIERLASPDRLDVVLIDVIWSTIMGKSSDGARDLLEAALRRDDTVTLLISEEASSLLEYMDGGPSADVRPHSVMAKSVVRRSNTYAAGALLAGFSAARQPFWSRGVDIAWAAAEGSEEIQASSLRLVCEEFACQAAQTEAARVTLTTLGGGLSDTVTMLVETQSSAAGGRTQQYMLKIAQDPKVLRDEIRNHDRLDHFPGTLFARFAGKPTRYAGWQALKFDAVQGRTLSALGLDAIGHWSSVFREELLTRYVKNAEHLSADPADILTGPAGALSPARWARLVGPGNSSLGDDLLARLRETSPGDILAGSRRGTATTFVHGDLHSRNVMIRSDNAVVLIDAASLDADGLWCQDPARLAVWLACENVQRASYSAADPAAAILGSALAITDKSAGAPSWTGQLRAAIEITLQHFEDLWQKAKIVIDVDEDWTVAVRAELLRVSYTSRVFDARTRRAAAELALDPDNA